MKISVLKLQGKAQVMLGNFFYKDLSKANIVIVYLLQDTNNRLIKKFIKELRPGTRIVSNTFIFPGWDIIRQDNKAQVYVYKV
jgi:hypothetical protein